MFICYSDKLIPVGFVDFDFMSDMDYRKSTSGYVFILGSEAISWRSINFECIANSTSEAEDVAACDVRNRWVSRIGFKNF